MAAAEALSLRMVMSHPIYLREVLAETLGVEVAVIPIKSFIDSEQPLSGHQVNQVHGG